MVERWCYLATLLRFEARHSIRIPRRRSKLHKEASQAVRPRRQRQRLGNGAIDGVFSDPDPLPFPQQAANGNSCSGRPALLGGEENKTQ